MIGTSCVLLCCVLLSCNAYAIRNFTVVQPVVTKKAFNLFNLPGLKQFKHPNLRLVEGDIAIRWRKRRTAYVEASKWPNGVVPFEIDSVYSEHDKIVIIDAMANITQATNSCIRFVERDTNSSVWVHINSSDGCWSELGMAVDQGSQDLSLERPDCVDHAVVLHELLHTLGFVHEHSRPDRDQYVRILSENIEPGQKDNFEILAKNETNTFGEPYDYGSIMHYADDTFSVNGKPTIKPIRPGYENLEQSIGRGDEMSAQDIKKLKMYYGCP